jgi:hypothetical protein
MAAIILIDGLTADVDDLTSQAANLPQNIITAATEKIEEVLTKQPATWPAA